MTSHKISGEQNEFNDQVQPTCLVAVGNATLGRSNSIALPSLDRVKFLDEQLFKCMKLLRQGQGNRSAASCEVLLSKLEEYRVARDACLAPVKSGDLEAPKNSIPKELRPRFEALKTEITRLLSIKSATSAT